MAKKYSQKDLMKIAIEEHLKCKEYPKVGAVVAKEGIILSTGYRGERKGAHAERIAIEKLNTGELENSTLFITLEPCVRMQQDQMIESCSELIIKSGIVNVVIGVLDPNGTIYSQGYTSLLASKISVSFFSRDLREAVEEETLEFGEIHKIYGHGKRRIPVVHSGTILNIQFSETDLRTIELRWSTLRLQSCCVDLISENGAVRIASGAKNFSDITDPMVFRFPSHFARMEEGCIAVIKPNGATFCVLMKLIKIYQNDILIQWELRNEKKLLF